jgi:autotransporter-associated beta strand protein
VQPTRNLFIRSISLSAITLLGSQSAQAAIRTWDGGGDGSTWSTSNGSGPRRNWDGETAFNSGDDAIFAGTVGLSPSIGGTSLAAGNITFNNTSGNFTIGGTATLTVNGGIVNNDNGLQTFSVSTITLGASQTWNAGNVTNGRLAFSGTTLNLGASQTLTIAGDNNTSISNTINGTGTSGILKTGSGTLTQSGIGNYTGTTTIKAGTLKLDGLGSIASTNIIVGDAGSIGAILDATTKTGNFTVASGQTVRGIGTIQGSTTIQLNGTIAPGNSDAGILNNLGNIALQAGSNLAIELGGTAPGIGGYDQLNVTGSATLGGLLAVSTIGGFNPTFGSLFFVLANDSNDAISGVFSNASVDGNTYTLGGQQYQISYFGNHTGGGAGTFTGGNDVALRAIPEPNAALIGGIGVLFLLRRRRSA